MTVRYSSQVIPSALRAARRANVSVFPWFKTGKPCGLTDRRVHRSARP